MEIELMSKLACVREGMRVYRYEDLPTRLHFSNNRRIEDIIIDLDPGYVVSVSYDLSNLGQHGYDYYQETMNVSGLVSEVCWWPEFLFSAYILYTFEILQIQLFCF